MTDKDRRGFVKAQTTSVPVDRSTAELQKMLRRYGATGFGVSADYASGQVRVFFRIPDEPGSALLVPVRLDVSTLAVYDALYGRPAPYRWDSEHGRVNLPVEPKHYDAKCLAQAERIAWRQLLLWVDAALSASAAGLQRISDAFLAHTLVSGTDGHVRRLAEEMDLASPTGNWKALLAPPGGERG